MAIYRAPKISKTPTEWLKLIAWRLIFPPIFILDILKFTFNALFGKFLGEKILLAQQSDYQTTYEKDYKPASNSPNIEWESHTIILENGAEIDTREMKHISQKDKSNAKKEYFIHFAGNAMCYEQNLDNLIQQADEFEFNIICFNYAGVSHSTGRTNSKSDAVRAGIAQIERLLAHGVDPENIYTPGRSLGGGFATLVAEYFHSRGKKINLFNQSSFSNITNVVMGSIRKEGSGMDTGHQEGRLGKVLSYLAWPFVKIALVLTDWEIEAADAYKKIPDTHKEYMLIRSSKESRLKMPHITDDPVITHYSSLHLGLQSERRKQKKAMDHAIRECQNANSALITSEINEAVAKLQAAKKTLKSRKMHVITNPYRDGHNIDPSELSDRYGNGNAASMFFRKFVERTSQHHEAERSRNHLMNR